MSLQNGGGDFFYWFIPWERHNIEHERNATLSQRCELSAGQTNSQKARSRLDQPLDAVYEGYYLGCPPAQDASHH